MDLFADLRTSLRAFLRRPFYPTVAVVILTLGLAAAVTVFTYFNGFSQAPPGMHASGLVRAFGVADDAPYQPISYLDFVDYAAMTSGSFDGVTAVQPFYAASVRREETTEVAFLTAVAGNFFDVFEIPMALGRAIRPTDDQPGADAVAVLSHRWWQRSFGGSPDVLGQTLYLNYRPFTIVGVANPEFMGTTSGFRPDVWIPIAPFRDRYVTWTAQAENRDRPLIRMYARLGDGVDREAAESELRTLTAGLDATYPRADGGPRGIRLASVTWIEPQTRAEELPTVRIMLLAAGGLLVLVCANVANLLLAVATGRLRDLAMRSALGASTARLMRMILVENVVLSTIAGTVALAIAAPASARLGSYFARPSVWGENVPREVAVDPHIVIFAVVVSILTGLAAGILPAVRVSRRQLVATLKSDATGAGPSPRRIGGWRIPGVHDVLVGSQVALSIVLLVVAALVLRTLASVRGLDSGFAHETLIASHISTSSTGVQPEERDRWFRELARRLAEEPWVRAATIVDNAPLSAQRPTPLRFEGQEDAEPLVMSRVVPDFFETVGIGLVEGRTFAVGDTAGGRDVAILNETAARRFFPGTRAVGRRLWRPGADGREREYEVVGIVRDAKVQDFLAPPEPVVYVSYPQHEYPSGSALLVAANGDPAASIQPLHAWLRRYEPHLAIVNVLPYTEVVRGFLYVQRMNAELFATLAFLGLALATAGIFSVVSLAVGRRRREMGIRMAIGARRGDIARLVVRRALTPVFVGLGAGLAGALTAAGLVRSLLYGVEPTDPVSLAGGAVVLMLAALMAAYLPARRATRVDPVQALRTE